MPAGHLALSGGVEFNQFDEFHTQVAAFKALVGQMQAGALSAAARSQLVQLARLSDEYDSTGEDVVRLAKTATEVYMGAATQMRAKAGGLLDTLVGGITAHEIDVVASVRDSAAATTLSLLVTAALAVLLMAAAIWGISRMIAAPIVDVTRTMTRLAEGDTTQRSLPRAPGRGRGHRPGGGRLQAKRTRGPGAAGGDSGRRTAGQAGPHRHRQPADRRLRTHR